MNTLAMPTNIPTPPTMPFTGAPVYMPTSSGTPIYMPMPPSAGAPMNMPSSMNVPIMPAAPFTAAQGFPPPQSEALSEHGWLAPIESPTTSPKKRFFTLRYFSFILLAALIVFIVISNCFIKINVVGSSMEPTFKSGDRVWANRWKAPAYGDVVVAYNPEGVPEFLYKRVVGFAGDSFFFSDSNLYRIKNGGTEQELLQEGINIDFIRDIFEKSSVFSGENQIYVVPADGLFLLGDNFNISKDSRFFGSVNKTAIYAVVY
jgi:signal peptidase I